MRRRLAIAALGMSCAWYGAGCRAPTEITLNLTTDVKCADFRGTTVTVGVLHAIETKAVTTTSTVCDASGNLGALVVVPSGSSNDEVAIKIIAGLARDPETCLAPSYGKGCIVARRALRFVPHQQLPIAVPLRVSCDGIPCDETQTCADGVCIAADDPRAGDCFGADGGCMHPAPVVVDAATPPPVVDAGPPGPRPCGDTTGLLAASPWPMSGGCPTHTGRSVVTGPRKVNVKWATPLSGSTFDPLSSGCAIAADGTLYVQNSNGSFDAIRADGSAAWGTLLSGNHSNSTPALGVDGTLYEGSNGGARLYTMTASGKAAAFGAVDDAINWSPALGHDGTIYAPALHLFAYDATGALRWSFPPQSAPPLKGVITAPAVGSTGVVYFAAGGALYAVNPDGTPAWSQLADVSLRASPSIGGDGTIYVGSSKNKLYAVRPDGTTKWTFATGGEVAAMPAIASDETIVVGALDGKVYAIRADGTLRWAVNAAVDLADPRGDPAGPASAVIDGTGAVYVAAGPGVFSAFTADGALMWSFTSPKCPTCNFGSAAIGQDGTIYAPADALFAFAP